MEDDKKTKRKLVEELNELRQYVSELKDKEDINHGKVNCEEFATAFLKNSVSWPSRR